MKKILLAPVALFTSAMAFADSIHFINDSSSPVYSAVKNRGEFSADSQLGWLINNRVSHDASSTILKNLGIKKGNSYSVGFIDQFGEVKVCADDVISGSVRIFEYKNNSCIEHVQTPYHAVNLGVYHTDSRRPDGETLTLYVENIETGEIKTQSRGLTPYSSETINYTSNNGLFLYEDKVNFFLASSNGDRFLCNQDVYYGGQHTISAMSDREPGDNYCYQATVIQNYGPRP
ncbi:hypothetical protein [Aliivibrio sifiae]|uniref:Uncharacterized protein n=1 Tax=Aliivibrio sifiae TaxID=566293 RepID=A0A2S7X9S1_9GAMM|nr:hypothetical protein [Aliivibrio sifiae]PQJ88100.1 hypothetical protein BTO22_00215 [Aliivibrio sifiae]